VGRWDGGCRRGRARGRGGFCDLSESLDEISLEREQGMTKQSIDLPIYASSRPLPSMITALPFLPALAVRPARWLNVFGSIGASYWITTSTSEKSTPREATSVQRRTAGHRCEAGWETKACRAVSRTRGGRSPCSDVRLKDDKPGRCERIYCFQPADTGWFRMETYPVEVVYCCTG
jgi:hypothetical protein